jgi:hypothetical protein
MKADLRGRLASFVRGEITPKTGVTPVTGVTGVTGNVPKLLKLQQLRLLRLETDKVANNTERGVTAHVTRAACIDDVEIDERAGLASDSVPAPYLDAWSRLQCQKPMRVSDGEWRQALDDAGRFLEQWRNLAAEFEWSPGDLFDAPHDGKLAGLAWWLRGETVRSFGPEHAVTEAGSVFDRLTRSEWQNPYQRRK